MCSLSVANLCTTTTVNRTGKLITNYVGYLLPHFPPFFPFIFTELICYFLGHSILMIAYADGQLTECVDGFKVMC